MGDNGEEVGEDADGAGARSMSLMCQGLQSQGGCTGLCEAL